MPAAAHPNRAAYTVASQTPTGPTPHFPAFDPTSGRLLVSNVGAVTEVEVGSGPTRSFAAGATPPHAVVVDGATRRAFVTIKGASSASVIDLNTVQQAGSKSAPTPHGLAVDDRYGRLSVPSIGTDRLEVADLATVAQITTIPVGDGPWRVAVGPGRIAVTDTAADTVHLLDRDALAVRDVVTVGAGPWMWRTPVGASPHGIVADHQRNTVIAAVTCTNQVAVLEARRGALIEAIAVADGPAGMAIDRRSGRVFVGNQAAGVVPTLTPARR